MLSFIIIGEQICLDVHVFFYLDPHIVFTRSVPSHTPLNGNLFINLYLIILGNLTIYPFELDSL